MRKGPGLPVNWRTRSLASVCAMRRAARSSPEYFLLRMGLSVPRSHRIASTITLPPSGARCVSRRNWADVALHVSASSRFCGGIPLRVERRIGHDEDAGAREVVGEGREERIHGARLEVRRDGRDRHRNRQRAPRSGGPGEREVDIRGLRGAGHRRHGLRRLAEQGRAREDRRCDEETGSAPNLFFSSLSFFQKRVPFHWNFRVHAERLVPVSPAGAVEAGSRRTRRAPPPGRSSSQRTENRL